MMKKWSPILLVALLFLLSSLACSGLLQDRNAPESAPATVQVVPTRTVAASQAAAQEAEQAIAEAAAGGTLRMTDVQFTSLIETQLAQSGAEVPVSNIVARFSPGEITVEGQLQEGVVPLLSGQLVMRGSLAVVNDAVVFDITEAKIRGISLPAAAISAFEGPINDALSQSNLGGRVRSITINEGEIVIEQE